ncbi:MAG: RimK family alpha-L-glutamate ligase [Betaproteobacteria bacterium]|nr:RimK family alpha-L-glutamate ligase [Betaproteobacteria bacterium]
MNSDLLEANVTTETKHPPLMGLAVLMRRLFAGEDLTPLAQQLLARASADDHDANALMDLSVVLQFRGQRDVALALQGQALAITRRYRLKGSQPTTLRVLVLMAPGDLMANAPLEFLVEDSDVLLEMLYLRPGEALPASVPDHDLVFVAVGESEQNIPLLRQLDAWLRSWPRPVINRPAAIARLGRDAVCHLLADVAGATIPAVTRVGRPILEVLAGIAGDALTPPNDGVFPFIVRPVDSHAGHGLAKAEGREDVRGYLSGQSGHEFYLTPFIDYRSADGLYRKYRIVLIEGRAYAAHLAISGDWMIHYLNAGMDLSEAKRAEEADFMRDFDGAFGRRHEAALRAIHQRVGLDYFAIDCGETPLGELVIFEVDSSMVVHALDSLALFPYKQAQMRKVFGAFRALLDHALETGAQGDVQL